MDAAAVEGTDAVASLLLDRDFDAQVSQVRDVTRDQQPVLQQLVRLSVWACSSRPPRRPVASCGCELSSTLTTLRRQLLDDPGCTTSAQLAVLLRARLPPSHGLLITAARARAGASVEFVDFT